ncbi:hypothetical protein AcV5_004188 [Taiwanofungus camphoratus]|nr:hypothetical protein AcV5_004188 [Antrodia cinnamomea]
MESRESLCPSISSIWRVHFRDRQAYCHISSPGGLDNKPGGWSYFGRNAYSATNGIGFGSLGRLHRFSMSSHCPSHHPPSACPKLSRVCILLEQLGISHLLLDTFHSARILGRTDEPGGSFRVWTTKNWKKKPKDGHARYILVS